MKAVIKIRGGYIVAGSNQKAIDDMQEQGYTVADFEGEIANVHVGTDGRFCEFEAELETGCDICHTTSMPLDGDNWCNDCQNLDLDDYEEKKRARLFEAAEY